MRWLFLLLLTANTLTFLWFYPRQMPEARVTVADDDQGLPELVLVSELNAKRKKLAGNDAATAGNTSQGEGKDTAAAMPQQPRSGANVPADQAIAVTTPAASTTQCFRIGPYASVDQTERSSLLLARAGWQADRSEVKDRVLVGKRMVLPGKMNQSVAQTKLYELQRKGIRDIAVIKDQGSFVVSLGFYSKQSSVERRQRELSRHGFQIQAVPVYRESKEYWLNASRVNGRDELPKIWKSLLKLTPGIGSSETNCR